MKCFRLFLLAAGTALSFLATMPKRALACATCSCGDPTLTIQGMEKPYAGRLRFSLEAIYNSEKFGPPGPIAPGNEHHEIWDGRLLLGTSWTPHERITLNLQIPLAIRHLDHFDGDPPEQTAGLGDVEFSGRVYLFRDDTSRHLAGLLAGARFPTTISHEYADGSPYSIDAEPGQGQWAPMVGAWYGYYNFPRFLFASVNALLPVGHGIADAEGSFDGGRAVAATLTGQYSMTGRFGVQLGFDTRWSERHQSLNGHPEDSGGFLGSITPGIVFSPVEDLLFRAYVQVPVAKDFNGYQRQGPAVGGALVYDLR